MEFTRLGTSGLTVSRIALGCMSFGGDVLFLDGRGDANLLRLTGVKAGQRVLDLADCVDHVIQASAARLQQRELRLNWSPVSGVKVKSLTAEFTAIRS